MNISFYVMIHEIAYTFSVCAQQTGCLINVHTAKCKSCKILTRYYKNFLPCERAKLGKGSVVVDFSKLVVN